MENQKIDVQKALVSDNPLSVGLWENVPTDTNQYIFRATRYGWVPKKIQ